MQVYHPTNHQGKQQYDKHYGRQLTTERAIQDALGMFFAPLLAVDEDHKRRRAIVTQLDELIAWAQQQQCLHLYASSVLIVYDVKRHQQLHEYHNHHQQHIYAIDFSHTFITKTTANDTTKDEDINGYAFGLATLARLVAPTLGL